MEVSAESVGGAGTRRKRSKRKGEWCRVFRAFRCNKRRAEWQRQRSRAVADGSRIVPASPAGRINEVRYEAKKTGRSAASVKKAVKKVGNSRKRVESTLGR